MIAKKTTSKTNSTTPESASSPYIPEGLEELVDQGLIQPPRRPMDRILLKRRLTSGPAPLSSAELLAADRGA